VIRKNKKSQIKNHEKNPKGRERLIFKYLIVLTKVVSIGIGTNEKIEHLLTIHLHWGNLGASSLQPIDLHRSKLTPHQHIMGDGWCVKREHLCIAFMSHG
jgi:hypothetical protein